MTTTVYFIRHAQSDFSKGDEASRPLTEKGMNDRQLVTAYLHDIDIGAMYSSPYKRAYDTVADLACSVGMEVVVVDGFRERRTDGLASDADFWKLTERQWADFSFPLPGGECLAEVQDRNITALNEILIRDKGKNIVIGTHGTALSTIINYYDNSYGFADFKAMVNIMPWIVKMDFNDIRCSGIEKIDLLQRD